MSASKKKDVGGLISFGGNLAYKKQERAESVYKTTQYDHLFKLLLIGDSGAGKRYLNQP